MGLSDTQLQILSLNQFLLIKKMCCSSEEVHPFIWTKPIISQMVYTNMIAVSSLLVSCWLLVSAGNWRFGYLGGQRGVLFSLPLKEMAVVTILIPPNFAVLEAENVNTRKQVATPTGERHSSPLFAPRRACTRSTRTKSRTGFHIHLVIPLGLYS